MSDRAFEEDDDKKKLERAKKGASSKTPLLNMFARDLNTLAKQGKLDPVIGMDEQVDQLTQILNKRKKKNALILGQPGVGKTCLAEGLAMKIVKKEVDRSLWDKQIFDFNISAMVSGTKYRGEFENRMEQILMEIKQNPDVILFIDEMHTMIGAGGSSGALDASNILKPALARGDMQCIGAMTLDDYKKHVENDPALDRRFQKVIVEPPSKEKMFDIAMATKHHYEDFHGVIFGSEEVKLLIDLCDRYITYRHFPDKAIDVMDEVGSFTKMKSVDVPEECKEMEEDLKNILAEKMVYASQQRYEDAALMRDKQRELQARIDKRYEEWKDELDKNRIPVKFNDIRTIISKHSGIEISKLTQDEKQKLRTVETHLNSRVIGQENAVRKVAQAIKRNKMDIHDPNRPFVMMFLGKTGTGKTLLAKTLAKYLFDSDSAFVRLDMSEYMDKTSTARLIGSPAGYVGYEDKGGLTQKIKNNPYSVILLDEIEKSHPDVLNMFLQVFEDGILTDSHGMTVNFKNCIIIMTSNIGTSELIDSQIGFDIGGDIDRETEAKVFKELKKAFKPEIINRIDEKILFTSIDKKGAEKIIAIEVDVLAQRLKNKGITMMLKSSMTKHLVDNGFDPDYGARPLKRLITSIIENEVAQQMLDENIMPGDTFRVGYDNKKQVITIDVDDRK